MNIALDYDETFTAMPVIFKEMVKLFKEGGHDVTFVTFRFEKYMDNEDIILDAHDLGINIVYTNGKQKAHCFDADIWIDDSPITIPRAIELGNMYDGCLVNNDMETIK